MGVSIVDVVGGGGLQELVVFRWRLICRCRVRVTVDYLLFDSIVCYSSCGGPSFLGSAK